MRSSLERTRLRKVSASPAAAASLAAAAVGSSRATCEGGTVAVDVPYSASAGFGF
jgi:hypothetical protein